MYMIDKLNTLKVLCEEKNVNMDKELAKVIADGKVVTRTSAVSYLLKQLELDTSEENLEGVWLGAYNDNWGHRHGFCLSNRKVMRVVVDPSFASEIKPLQGVRIVALEKKVNRRTNNEWYEWGEETKMEGVSLDIYQHLQRIGDIKANDYYCVNGYIRWVNPTAIFENGKKVKDLPFFEHNLDGGTKLNIKLVVADDTGQESMRVTLAREENLLMCYPPGEASPEDIKWLKEQTGNDNVQNELNGLQNEEVVIFGRGSKQMKVDEKGKASKTGEKIVELENAWLTVEEGFIVNSVNIAGARSATPLSPTQMPKPQSPATTMAQPKDLRSAIIAKIEQGKGTPDELLKLKEQFSVEPTAIANELSALVEEGKIVKQGKSFIKVAMN